MLSLEVPSNKAWSKCHSVLVPNPTNELRAAVQSVWFGSLGLEQQTKLSLAGSAALCDSGAAVDLYGALLLSQT